MNKAVFLDRDGTVIVHVHYLRDPEQVAIVPDGADALRRLQERGYLLVIVSNQSLVGRGYGTLEDVEAVNGRMGELLATDGVTLAGVKYCPHHPDANCPNRKPNPGMLLEAAKELDIDLARSAMIGDNLLDVEAGTNAGCMLNILIDVAASVDHAPSATSLSAAADLILES